MIRFLIHFARILICVVAASSVKLEEGIYTEVLRHSIFCRDRSKAFVGRTAYTSKVCKSASYINLNALSS